MDLTGVVKDAFGGRGLAGVDVGNDADIADLAEVRRVGVAGHVRLFLFPNPASSGLARLGPALESLARKHILHSLPPEEPGSSASQPHAHRRAPLIPALHRPASLPACSFRKLGIHSTDSSRADGFTAVLRAGGQGIMAPLG